MYSLKSLSRFVVSGLVLMISLVALPNWVLAAGAEPHSVAACQADDHANKAIEFNPDDLHMLPPVPSGHGPITVDIGLYIDQLTAVDETKNTFQIEGFIDLVWCDPRLAYTPVDEAHSHGIIMLMGEAQGFLNEHWWPDIVIANQVSARGVENQEVILFPNGTVEYKEKFSAELEAHYRLQKFPFDHQALEIEIESFAWNEDQLVLHMETDKIGFSDKFELAEWHIDDVHTEIKSVKEIRDRATFSEFLMEIEVTRKYDYYIWKIILPLIALVMISWSVFWMLGDGLGDRMSVSITGILTVVAYQFVIASILPRVPYFTFMDAFLTLSFLLMGLTVLVNVLVNVFYLNNKEGLAKRIDNISRIAFPSVYVAGLVLCAEWFYIAY